MIIEVSGDILLSNTQVIAHGIAPNDDFATGLAVCTRIFVIIAKLNILKQEHYGLGWVQIAKLL